MVCSVMIVCLRLKHLGSLPALLLVVSAAMGAPNALQIRTNYYAVTGATLPEIRCSVDQGRPRSGDERHDGLTTWHIKWKTAIQDRGGVSRLSSFTTQTAITLTLPRWIAPTNAAPGLVKAWNDYAAALYTHEQGHIQLVHATIAELHARTRTVPPGTGSQSLRQQIEELAQGILATDAERHANYDRLTRHGETQGARLAAGRRPQQTTAR